LKKYFVTDDMIAVLESNWIILQTQIFFLLNSQCSLRSWPPLVNQDEPIETRVHPYSVIHAQSY
jgi:hypothetical protein